MRCPNCGATVESGAKRCPHCHATFVASTRGWIFPAVMALVWLVVVVVVVVMPNASGNKDARVEEAANVRSAPQTPTTADVAAAGTQAEAGEPVEAGEHEEPFTAATELPQEYQAPYYWQARSVESAMSAFDQFQIVVGEGIPEGALIGSWQQDLNGDGTPEVLSCRWRGQGVTLEVEGADGTVRGTVRIIGDFVDWPLQNDGTLDVLVNDAGTLLAQWTSGPIGIGDGWFWDCVRYEVGPDGSIQEVGRAHDAGSYATDLSYLKQCLREIGVSDAAIPDISPEGDFLSHPLSDVDTSYHVICRLQETLAAIDYDAVRDILSSGNPEWCAPQAMGTLTITQPART